MTTDLFWRFLGCLIPLLGSATGVWGIAQKRRNWITNAEHSLSRFGTPFDLIDKWPLYITWTFLALLVAASILAIFGGVIGYVNINPSPQPTITQGTAPQSSVRPAALPKAASPQLSGAENKLTLLFEYSLWIAAVFLATAAMIYFNVIQLAVLQASKLVGYFDPTMYFHPGWINARWHIRNDEAIPINTNLQGCEQVANVFITSAIIQKIDYASDRAKKPKNISDEDLPNLLLISNVVESSIHKLAKGGAIQFSEMYDQLGIAAANVERPFSPTAIQKLFDGGKSLYPLLKEITESLPNEPTIETAVNETVTVLAKSYLYQARGLAIGTAGIGYSSRVLFRRLKGFPALKEQGMRAQVIKLGIDWEVWPGMDPGPFMYPFSKNVARLLMNLKCILTLPQIKSIPCESDFQHLTAWASDRIVDIVARTLTTTQDEQLIQSCLDVFGSKPKEVGRWRICREVDYFLWNQSRQTKLNEGGVFGKDASSPWVIDNNDLVRQ